MLYGHEEKEKIFKNLVKKDMLSHAYLFFGENQIGKFHFAKHLAYFLEYQKFNILEKPLVDAVIIKHPEDRKTIGINQLKELSDFFHQKPLVSDKRLIIIDEAHRLTRQAQASLLKLVEEAPDHVTFIFITNDKRSLLPPLLSRLQENYFRKISTKKIQKILEEDFQVSNKESEKIARLSFGCIGRAIHIVNDNLDYGDDLEGFLNKKITNLFLKDKKLNSKKIKELLDKKTEVERFSLNPKLQKKAVQHILNKK